MSGEGLSVSFRRTSQTKESNDELLWKFQNIVYSSNKIMSHMKWYGKEYSVQLIEHGDEELQKWQQEDVAIKDTFNFYISVRESWGKDSNYYECHKTEGSFVSVAQKFALDYNLMYFPFGFPAEWIEQEIIDGKKHWNHFDVKPDDKNIDRICDVWHNYSIIRITQDTDKHWNETKELLKNLMNKEKCAITQ